MGVQTKTHILERTWWHDTERALAKCFINDISDLFNDHGVEESPLLWLRVDDVLTSFLAVRRLEDVQPANTEDAAPRTKPPVDGTQIEAAGKARERLRKAMKELEESCAKAGAPIDRGLADITKPLLTKAEGVLDDALAFEARRKTRNDDTHDEHQ